jgi:UDPglucose 6-dehydrogenase
VDKIIASAGNAEKVAQATAMEAFSVFDVVLNPVFLREGAAVEDFMKPDRVVIGTSSEKAENLMKRLYEPFVRQGNPVLFMDVRSAELTKYASNSYLATRISFMNEIANLCEQVGANVNKVRIGMGNDHRIGKRFLFPGVGYGGSCFPKDVKALLKTAQESDYNFQILNSVDQVNKYQRTMLVDKVDTYFNGQLEGRKLALWGLSFKPNTDDIREAPARYMLERLIEAGADVTAFDPEATENMKALFGDKITFAEDQYEVLEGAEALLIATEWTVFRTPDFDKMKEKLKHPVIFDGRNVYRLKQMREHGFYYNSIGRAIVNPEQANK